MNDYEFVQQLIRSVKIFLWYQLGLLNVICVCLNVCFIVLAIVDINFAVFHSWMIKKTVHLAVYTQFCIHVKPFFLASESIMKIVFSSRIQFVNNITNNTSFDINIYDLF